ncbi:MAG: cytochrome c1, partial [Pseudolabrys sp.]
MTMHRTLIAFALAASVGVIGAAQAQVHESPKPPAQKWSFSGPFGKFDQAQLQRGFKIYKEVCSACHSMSLVS